MNFNKYYDLITSKVTKWAEDFVIMLPNLILALLVIIIFVLLAKLIRNLFSKLLTKALGNKSLSVIISKIIYFIVFVIGTFVALSLLNLDKTVTSLLAGAGILGLALGFAFQDIATNFIAGFMMAIKRPFRVGEVIHCEGHSGVVKHLGIRTTEITSFQGQEIIIPNKMLFQNPIINDSENVYKRIDLNARVSYGEDLERVRAITIEAVKNIPNIQKEREITFVFTDFDKDAVNFTIKIWVEYLANNDFSKSRSEAIIAIKKAYDENGIKVPFPIRSLDFGVQGGVNLDEVLP